jgi:hypothetical protein
MATGLQLGDRVRVNEACPYQELIGSERFVVGLSIRKDATINVWLADRYPPQNGGDDDWSMSELDRIAP